MKKIICVLLLISICLSFGSCSRRAARYQEEIFYVMDTAFMLRLYGDEDQLRPHFAAVHALLVEIEHALSRTKPDSDVSRINSSRSADELSPHTIAVLQEAARAVTLTDGAYLPTMGAVTELWKQAETLDQLPDAEALTSALAAAQQGFTLENGACTLHGEGALLDLGGIGKGYAADCVLSYLRENHVGCALLSFGSSVATFGQKPDGTPFTVSLRHPRNRAATVGILTDPRGVLSVSGDYERYVTVGGEQYHHVLDPQTGYPTASGVACVAVLCENGALSDALSTAFMVMGREKAQHLLQGGAVMADAVFVTAEGQTHTTTAQFTAN